jgi:hypothetical protein
MHQPGRQRRRRLGSYGAGTLWCFRSRNGLFMLFDDHLIAKRGHPRARAWLAFDASWIVTSIVRGELLVQHNDDEGVVVSLQPRRGIAAPHGFHFDDSRFGGACFPPSDFKGRTDPAERKRSG